MRNRWYTAWRKHRKLFRGKYADPSLFWPALELGHPLRSGHRQLSMVYLKLAAEYRLSGEPVHARGFLVQARIYRLEEKCDA